MDYLTFKQHLAPFPVFSLATIRLYAPTLSSVQLSRWVEKGYLKRIVKGYYLFADTPVSDSELFLVSNAIYAPSYITAESALSFYGIIPEAVYQTTAMTTRHTYTFTTPLGEFVYGTVKPELFFGYTLLPYGNHNICIATLEKALLDMLYKHSHLKTFEDFEELRLNFEEMKKIDVTLYTTYMGLFPFASFKKRASTLLDYIHAYIL